MNSLTVRYAPTSRHHGFTLIELLVVIMILAILMAVASPHYISAVKDAEQKVCRANMQTIANTVQAARVRLRANDYDAIIRGGVTTSNLPDFQTIPVCPAGGSYTLTIGSSGDSKTYQVRCSLPQHGSFEPGVDSK